MEADERTKLPEVNDVPMKKSVNVLEALDNYNLKRQQDRERNMMDTTEDKKKRDIIDLERRLSPKSVQPTGSQCSFTRNTKKSTKRANFKQNNQARHNKFFAKKLRSDYSYLKDLVVNQLENGSSLKHVCEVGITEFVSQCQGFSAVTGHCFFDTQVHEICLDGSIVHLTSKHSPGSSFVWKHYPTEEEQLAVCAAEEWNTIEEMVKTGKPEVVEINVTGKRTAEKKKIRRFLKMKYDDIDNNSVTIDGETIMKIFKKKKNNRQGRQQGKDQSYTQFVLYKENQTTVEALNTIANNLKMKSGSFTTAGSKVKKAITSQLVTVKNVEPHLLFNSVKHNASISIGNFSYTKHPLRSYSLRGNRFTIALRNVIGDERTILTSLNSVKEMGFINYNELRHFGMRHMPTHFIGKQLLLGNWKEAINLILKPGCLNGNHPYSDVTMALIEYESSKDAQNAFGKITRNFQTIEAKLLFNLTKCGEDIVGALKSISCDIRVPYMRAYQSFIWNTVASKRLATFGLQPIIGDLVYVSGDRDNCGENGPNYNRPVIFIDEKNIHKYTIHDVILPLPGWHIVFPTNQIGLCYRELFQADGLSVEDFRRSCKMFNLSGMYRFMISKPFDMKWKFVHYKDPNVSLIQSDKERLRNKAPFHPGTQGGTFRGIVLEFNLSVFAFTSMVIREITKMDMTAECQTKFRGNSKRSQNLETQSTWEAERCPIELESCKNPTTANGNLQTNESPGVNNQHTLATENSCIRPEFKVHGVQLGRSQNLAAPASTVPEEPILRTIKFELGVSAMPPPAVPKCLELPQKKPIKEEPGISNHLTSGAKDKSEELHSAPVFTIERYPVYYYGAAPQKPETEIIKKERDNRHYSAQTDLRMLAEKDKCPRSERERNENLKYLKRIKEEPDIIKTPTPKVGKSPEKPEKKRIKVEPVTLQDRSTVKKMPLKEPKKEPVIVVDLTSDQED